jgi:drug/metabolite transporter (DMT)-like permease
MTERRQGLLLLATVVLAWGLTWPVNKVILASLSPLWWRSERPLAPPRLLATPVVSVLIATFWLGETLTASLAIAIVLILGGVAIGATGDVTSLRVASDPP